MERTASEHIRGDTLDLPEGYTVRAERVLEEESGEVREVLLVMRADNSVAWAFALSASDPTVEEVSRRAWEDYRATLRSAINDTR